MTDTRKEVVNSKTVALLMLSGGLPAVASKHATAGIAPKTVAKAISEDLAPFPEAARALQGWRDATFTPSNGKRGRPAVAPGASREYRVQAVGDDGDPFLRVPVRLVGAVKGDVVKASFGRDADGNSDGTILLTFET